MDFVIILQRGAEVLAVDSYDLEGQECTIAKAAEALASELWAETGAVATSYVVLGWTEETVWCLQASTKLKDPRKGTEV